MSRNLLVRIAVAVPAIAGAVAALWLGGWVLAAAFAVLGVLGTNEVYAFAKKQGVEPLEWVGFVAAAAFPFATYWAKDYADWEPVVYGGAAWLLVALVVAAARGPERHPLTALAVTSFGPLYASALLAFLVAIRHGPHVDAHPRGSVALAVMPLVITWVCDTCAMAAGALVGGPKLAPVLSPRKTWAGAIGGVVGGLLAALAYGPLVLGRVALRRELGQLGSGGVGVGGGASGGAGRGRAVQRGAGVEATLAALAAGKRVALANKETLVMAGELVTRTAREGGGEIVPVDSEHSAVLQCITGRSAGELARLILTASGGPFRTWNPERVARATVDEALRHPTWKMGKKITVDSASLVTKALEAIEAHFLFGLPYESVDVVVHPQSVVHAFVEFVDGSVLAQVGFPTMGLPILYALTHPDRVPDAGARRFDPVAAGTLTFEPVAAELYPAYGLGRAAALVGGTAATAFNAANEVAVELFLEGKIRFGRIAETIARVLEAHHATAAASLETVLAADADARRLAREAACS